MQQGKYVPILVLHIWEVPDGHLGPTDERDVQSDIVPAADTLLIRHGHIHLSFGVRGFWLGSYPEQHGASDSVPEASSYELMTA